MLAQGKEQDPHELATRTIGFAADPLRPSFRKSNIAGRAGTCATPDKV